MEPDTGVETYDVHEAADYVRDVAGEECDVVEDTIRDHDFAVEWHGNNRIDVFKHLLEHGWAVTSADSVFIWFERVGGLTEADIEVESTQ